MANKVTATHYISVSGLPGPQAPTNSFLLLSDARIKAHRCRIAADADASDADFSRPKFLDS
jgi:hypothetical protein